MSDQVLAAPLTPSDCNLRDLDYMPLDVVRFLKSDLVSLATPAEGWAALQLWLNSWLEVPAASLLDNDRVLARAAGVSLAEWHEVREMALRNWVRASDGRLYHPHVAEKALVAWIDRLRLRRKSAQGNLNQGRKAQDPASFDLAIGEALDLLSAIAPDTALRFDDPRGQKDKPKGSKTKTRGDTQGDTNRDTLGETKTTPTGAEKQTEVEVEVEDIEEAVVDAQAREPTSTLPAIIAQSDGPTAADDWPSDRVMETLVETIASPRLDPAKSPQLVQTSGRLAAWKRAGASWEFDVVPVVMSLCAKSKTPVRSWDYFRDAVLQSVADNRQALTLPEASQQRPAYQRGQPRFSAMAYASLLLSDEENFD